MDKSFEGARVLISGGSKGIGLSTAKLLAKKGAHITIVARNWDRIQQSINEIKESRLTDEQVISGLPVDVTDEENLNREISHWIGKNGSPDLLINAAGFAHPGEITDLSNMLFHKTMDINYFGTVNLIKAVLPSMIKESKGTIVNISSSSGFLGIFGYTAYSGSKYAVRGFSEALRNEMNPRGIHVCIVYPPDTDTDQLAYEAKYKPQITKELAGNAGLMSPEKVAECIVSGIAKKKKVILPGVQNQIIYRLQQLFGDFTYVILDKLAINSWNKIHRN